MENQFTLANSLWFTIGSLMQQGMWHCMHKHNSCQQIFILIVIGKDECDAIFFVATDLIVAMPCLVVFVLMLLLSSSSSASAAATDDDYYYDDDDVHSLHNNDTIKVKTTTIRR